MSSAAAAFPVIRRATPEDVPRVVELLDPFVQRQQLLPRTDEELQKLATNGFVAEAEGHLVGFAAVEVYSRKMAELQCLAVADAYQKRGVGRQLIQHCVRHAKTLGVLELMAITASDRLFQDCGFDYSLPDQKRALFIHPRSVPD